MKCVRNATILFFLASTIILIALLKIVIVYADTQNNINTTIKISVCGNNIIEGGEDCEGVNLNNQTCETIGYGPGTLSCDIACSFDTYNCSPAPTPTFTPTPTPTLSPTSTPTPTPGTTTNSSSSITPTTSQSTPTITPTQTTTPILPPFVLRLDPNNDGRISIKEVFAVAKDWVEQWRQQIAEEAKGVPGQKQWQCDLNRDYKCNLTDLSILLFYVER